MEKEKLLKISRKEFLDGTALGLLVAGFSWMTHSVCHEDKISRNVSRMFPSHTPVDRQNSYKKISAFETAMKKLIHAGNKDGLNQLIEQTDLGNLDHAYQVHQRTPQEISNIATQISKNAGTVKELIIGIAIVGVAGTIWAVSSPKENNKS